MCAGERGKYTEGGQKVSVCCSRVPAREGVGEAGNSAKVWESFKELFLSLSSLQPTHTLQHPEKSPLTLLTCVPPHKGFYLFEPLSSTDKQEMCPLLLGTQPVLTRPQPISSQHNIISTEES